MTEIWKPVPEWPHLEASSLGNVRTIDRVILTKSGVKRRCPGQTLKQRVGKRTKRATVSFFYSAKMRTITVHRLVAFAFCDRSGGRVVNHIDGNRLNNMPDNLEWCTQEENLRHAAINNLRGKRPFHRDILQRAKIRTKDIPVILDLLTGKSQREVARIYKVSHGVIGRIYRRHKNADN